MILLLALLAGAGATTTPVDELRALLTQQPQLAASVQYNLRHAPEDYAGTYGRDLEGLFAFFEEWQHAPVVPYAPTVTRQSENAHFETFASPMWALAFATGDACSTFGTRVMSTVCCETWASARVYYRRLAAPRRSCEATLSYHDLRNPLPRPLRKSDCF